MKKGILLVNLGSPDSPEVKDVKPYLDEFLMDERVIDVPPLARNLLVRGIILNTRPKKSAAAYKSIWWEEGSPLIVLSKRLQAAVQQHTDLPVGLGMRYGNPSIEQGVRTMLQQNPELTHITVVPLYPHYAMSSYETVAVKVQQVFAEHFPNVSFSLVDAFYNDPRYLDVLSEVIKENLPESYDHILFSYHGIPERHVRKSDITKSHCLTVENCCAVASPAHKFCYRHQTLTSTEEVVQRLGIPKSKYSNSFQSRLDSKWLRPFTDKELEAFPAKGIKELVVVCPAFVSDCLETIEEIGEEGRETFLKAGGEAFTLIPCLNDADDWAKLVAQMGREH
jgi:ferrochelatase